MDQYVESLSLLIGNELDYDVQKTDEIRKSLQVISKTLVSGTLFSVSVYLWYQSLSLFSISGGSISLYMLYYQLCSLYCQVRIIQDPKGHVHTYEHEFSRFKAVLLSKAYNGGWDLFNRVQSTPIKKAIKVKVR